ncbi:DUF6799 domain-containing protein [Hymenobacter defluvii]|uniref:DUF6799 domain-containing protein n=1 Tax=Hymenobacter defluvii TaxID=2054411 RepID=A0ABS3TCD2_9BACT|nr:DUF6799 domain-containing protein [Hymenobacter defluvii]MBO3271312.1 hypothetical protein [Hymenobacter defluvii]
MKVTVLLAALLLSSTALTAQAQTTPSARKTVQPKPRVTPKGATMKEGFMMKDGQVMRTQSGATNPLRDDVTLPSGVKVATNGTLTATDGRSVTLQEGDMVSPTGRLTTAASVAAQDSLARATMDKAKSGKKKGKRN